MQRFSAIMGQLANMLQLPELDLDEGGTCSIQLDDMVITFRYDPATEMTLVFSPLCLLPDKNPARLELMLEANAFYSGSGGFTLALHGGELAMLQTILSVASLDAGLLYATLERFVHTQEYWAERLAAPLEQVNKDAPAESGGFDVRLLA